MKTVGIIRERGQLTIPDSIRKVVSWVTPLSAVSISVIKPDEILIKPLSRNMGWDMTWQSINKSRAIVGKGKISALEFIEKDRNSH